MHTRMLEEDFRIYKERFGVGMHAWNMIEQIE